MNFFEEWDTLQKNIPYYYKFTMFLCLHWFRMSLVWCHKVCIKPIEHILHPYIKEEPEEDKWVQIYTMTKDVATTQFASTGKEYYRSFETYFYPYTTDFLKFVENEFMFFTENPMQLKEDNQSLEIMETLFLVRTHDQCIVKSFSTQKPITPIDWTSLPKLSEISFSFVEYYHPKMVKPLEIVLTSDFYTIGNDLFTTAFVLRQLELMNCYFIFDKDYEIHLIDHKIKEIHLKIDQSIVISKDSYKIINHHAVENDLEDSPILSEARYWWNFHC